MEADERFSKLNRDPRFKKIPRKERRVKIDSRFEKMFTDESFRTRFSMDKRGKITHETEVEDLTKFYELGKDEECGDAVGTKESGNEVDTDESADEVDTESGTEIDTGEPEVSTPVPKETTNKMKKKKGKLLAKVTGKNTILSSGMKSSAEKNKRTKLKSNEKTNKIRKETKINFDDIRGETLPESYDSSDSDESEKDFKEDENEDSEIIHGWGDLDENVKCIENAETVRLAVCNCDWDKIGADDLFVLFNSFKPVDGEVKFVKIYPSEFGKKRMEEEKVSGPKELVATSTVVDTNNGEEEYEEGSQFHMEKLREYQMNRLKYFYAVVECDSVNTANKLYEELDGQEYEMSATRLDLRFIPDETTFDEEPKSVASAASLLKNYEPVTFHNTALQQSTVRLTWDETDAKRVQTTMRKFDKDEIENMDFRDYLASSSDEEEEENSVANDVGNAEEDENVESITGLRGKSKIEAYKQLLQEIDEKEEKNENLPDMQVSFKTSKQSEDTDKVSKFTEMTLKNSSRYKDKNNDSESEIEMESDDEDDEVEDDDEEDEDDDEEDEDDKGDNDGDYSDEKENAIEDSSNGHIKKDKEDIENGFNDPFFDDTSLSDKKTKKTKSKKKAKKHLKESEEKMTEGEEKKKNELELLILDEEEDKKHFHLKDILDQEKNKKSKRKRKIGKDVKEVSDNFEINVNDPRFSALYSSHLYSLDPSDPNFKRTKATQAIIEASQKKRRDNEVKNISKTVTQMTEDKFDPKLSEMIKSVKSKTALHKWKKDRKKVK